MELQKILYIEDDLANKVLVRKVLKAEGFEVVEAEDGITGIEAAEQHRPDLILLDMSMPVMDGYETATQLKAREHLAQIPVIAVTANVMPGDRARAIGAGCDGFISKPIDIDTFVDSVRHFLVMEQS